jgi:hypothetical protein
MEDEVQRLEREVGGVTPIDRSVDLYLRARARARAGEGVSRRHAHEVGIEVLQAALAVTVEDPDDIAI